MEKFLKRRPVGMTLAALGVLLLLLTVVSGGASILVPRTIADIDDAEALGAGGGRLYRPFAVAEFDFVSFSGLYLSDANDTPQIWVMWGFLDDCAVCFYLTADGADLNGDGAFTYDDAPADALGVEYILRAAQPALHERSEWVLTESITDTAAYYEMSESEASQLFAGGVLEASRSGLLITRIAFAAGVVTLLAGAALLILPERRPQPDPEDAIIEDAPDPEI